MANFVPLRNYMIFCLEALIVRHDLNGPFLDVGCGKGAYSLHLARRGWCGTAIDSCSGAAAAAANLLKSHSHVKVMCGDPSGLEETYNTILLFDVLEHVEDDLNLLACLRGLLQNDGVMVICVPSNPAEWRWDDEFYGHYRRYSVKDLAEKLARCGLVAVDVWDCTFPLFWVMRRLYTFFMRRTRNELIPIEERTAMSSLRDSWQIPLVSSWLSCDGWVWRFLYKAMFRFRFCINRNMGHEMIVCARIRE